MPQRGFEMDGYDKDTGEIVAAIAGVSVMPREIAAAIIAVARQIKKLGVDDKNEHGKYQFVSVDKFYERIGPLMAEAGLVLLIDDAGSEVKEGKSGNPWLFIQYNLAFMHESGAMSAPLRRSCALPISGPQAFGSAQSFTEKYFLRQVFKVSTGDKDGDDIAPVENVPGNAPRSRATQERAPAASAAPAPAQAPPAPSPDVAEARRQHDEIRSAIDAAVKPEDIDRLLESKDWERLDEIGRRVAPNEHEAVLGRLRARAERRRDMLKEDRDAR